MITAAPMHAKMRSPVEISSCHLCQLRVTPPCVSVLFCQLTVMVHFFTGIRLHEARECCASGLGSAGSSRSLKCICIVYRMKPLSTSFRQKSSTSFVSHIPCKISREEPDVYWLSVHTWSPSCCTDFGNTAQPWLFEEYATGHV